MANNDEAQETSKDQINTELSSEEQKKKKPEELEVIEKNPDIEDPRLFSPLQEPDRPAPTERSSEEKKNPEDSKD